MSLVEIINRVREKHLIPAVAVSMISSDREPENTVVGYRIAGNDRLATIHDYFHIGSCSKSVLSVIAAKLVEERKVQWDESFFKIFPELLKNARTEYFDITLSDLLLCQAGIAAFTDLDVDKMPEFGSDGDDQDRLTFIRFLISRHPVVPRTRKGFRHCYSNASYTMASAMIERISGLSYRDLALQTLTDALGLSFWIGWPNHLNPEQPWGHQLVKGKLVLFPPAHPYHLPPCLTPAGNLSMPAVDFARYVQFHLRGLIGKETYLTAGSFQKLHFGVDVYSYGIANGSLGGLILSGMDGSLGTFFCRAMIFPGRDRALAIMMNAGTGGAIMPAMNELTMKIIKSDFGWRWKWWL
ncbi:MAG TPA: serine hydrolase domain-containing protein [Kiritimatiellia bacterium]|nr:serine hydrolase domain-containing protein [Kiritimatiellia bacterium]